MEGVTLLGSTGSIGQSTLNIIAAHSNRYNVVALTAHSQVEKLFEQCLQFHPRYAVIKDEGAAKILQERLKSAQLKTEVLSGPQALEEVAQLTEVSIVVAAIVGAAGLASTLAAAKAGKRILLANKEALVMSGALMMAMVEKHQALLLPVDSEHNAIFQSLPLGYVTGQKSPGVEKLILTASGGPFHSLPLEQFSNITPEQAIAHPNWSMGAKISVDSATMMNKGLEVIEAHWLFAMPAKDIEVLLHPQSIIHSMVNYQDGSTLAQLGLPDMRTPIAYALSWPNRITSGVKSLNLLEIGQLNFMPLDYKRFPALPLAYEALEAGGTASTVLNAANEQAVAAFLARKIRFTDIVTVVSEVLEASDFVSAFSVEQILGADKEARYQADVLISRL